MQGRKGERQKNLGSPEHPAGEGEITGGRSGGSMAQKIGSEDELKRAFKRPAGVTRVQKSDKKQTRPQLKTDRQ